MLNIMAPKYKGFTVSPFARMHSKILIKVKKLNMASTSTDPTELTILVCVSSKLKRQKGKM